MEEQITLDQWATLANSSVETCPGDAVPVLYHAHLNPNPSPSDRDEHVRLLKGGEPPRFDFWYQHNVRQIKNRGGFASRVRGLSGLTHEDDAHIALLQANIAAGEQVYVFNYSEMLAALGSEYVDYLSEAPFGYDYVPKRDFVVYGHQPRLPYLVEPILTDVVKVRYIGNEMTRTYERFQNLAKQEKARIMFWINLVTTNRLVRR